MSDNLRWLTSEMLDFMRSHTSQELCEMAQSSFELEKELEEFRRVINKLPSRNSGYFISEIYNAIEQVKSFAQAKE